jgi:membrane protein YdbS with pleckstrin-like domain
MAEAPPIPEPARTLSPRARWAWRANWVVAALIAFAVGRILDGPLPDGWDPVLWGVPLAVLLVGAPLVPALEWRRWRWEVREHEIDLMRGILVVRRTLIPMGRVQHVETSRGLLGQAFGLATVEVHTAAGSHTIPLLTEEAASLLRNRIAELARTDDDEATEPAEPIEPAEPTEPTEPGEPTEPTEPTGPTEPAGRSEADPRPAAAPEAPAPRDA